ncbi:trypsin-1 [Plutella xylostella]|uniref:trypsin-1 n=1 Tax=Plutella xylostella TaxID=51655 RepID=UPI00203319DC|nr:trypsin-1 [Plutella xylostella]
MKLLDQYLCQLFYNIDKMKILFAILFFILTPSDYTLASSSLTSPRIINGVDVDISRVPYQAALRRRVAEAWSHSCGAVVVHSRAVLTAAHCVLAYKQNPDNLRVLVGTSYRSSGGSTYPVTKVEVHKDYSSTSLNNDIAVLQTSFIVFSDKVLPIKIIPYGAFIPDGSQAIVSGYGVTESATASRTLRSATVNIVPQSACLRAYLSIATVTSEMICAVGANPGKDACQGDSGGPLAYNGYLIGLVSWGEGCADVRYPGVYTRVSVYTKWIQEVLDKIDKNTD